MDDILELVIGFLASSGFWSVVIYLLQKKDARTAMLLGLAHDRIIDLELKYIERGYITPEEFENLHDYLYLPYKKMGGNGTAEKLMEDIKHLPNTNPQLEIKEKFSHGREY